ncbi:uncharacterized protein CLAFUR5_12532 [Fulvia fulva]|uniref:Uncharacterized protein n=1 Tax=Passalora fulva TaxID=5499 RepID=A0A9Q8PJU7_PASFU|nr:uncharacterized protein CLAFUR5_12532 [Fulvia fulva]UJO23793.1 hypothetical protein CLAFUR5_12532 [Fulvia fulva]WPV35830.1 hypothetical protein CLAFUW7_12671 [Fulvia fulva]
MAAVMWFKEATLFAISLAGPAIPPTIVTDGICLAGWQTYRARRLQQPPTIKHLDVVSVVLSGVTWVLFSQGSEEAYATKVAWCLWLSVWVNYIANTYLLVLVRYCRLTWSLVLVTISIYVVSSVVSTLIEANTSSETNASQTGLIDAVTICSVPGLSLPELGNGYPENGGQN